MICIIASLLSSWRTCSVKVWMIWSNLQDSRNSRACSQSFSTILIVTTSSTKTWISKIRMSCVWTICLLVSYLHTNTLNKLRVLTDIWQRGPFSTQSLSHSRSCWAGLDSKIYWRDFCSILTHPLKQVAAVTL